MIVCLCMQLFGEKPIVNEVPKLKISLTINQFLGLHSQRLFEQIRIESN